MFAMYLINLNFLSSNNIQARFSTAHFLAGHMQKIHVAAELPYNCGCCDYTSSSHRQTIDHFSIEHCSSGTLQCPLCLKVIIYFYYDYYYVQYNVCKTNLLRFCLCFYFLSIIDLYSF